MVYETSSCDTFNPLNGKKNTGLEELIYSMK